MTAITAVGDYRPRVDARQHPAPVPLGGNCEDSLWGPDCRADWIRSGLPNPRLPFYRGASSWLVVAGCSQKVSHGIRHVGQHSHPFAQVLFSFGRQFVNSPGRTCAPRVPARGYMAILLECPQSTIESGRLNLCIGQSVLREFASQLVSVRLAVPTQEKED